jgi:carboxyl-terminal processing protease
MHRALFALILVIATGTSAISAASNTPTLKPIEKQSDQTALYREIFDRLATRHYRTQIIDDELSRQYLEEYLDQLDPLKAYFLKSDIKEFNQWQTRLDDLARRGDISPGFFIFNRLRERATAQLQANIALLEDPELIFDYSLDETIELDGEKREWLANEEAAKVFWRKRIKDSMIRLLLNDKEDDKARELLVKRYRNQIKQYAQRNSQDVFQLYVNALAGLYDPHTAYYSPRTTENFNINMSLSLEGIGAQLTTEDDYTKIVSIIPGGPADEQGLLKPEDKIIGVAQGDDEFVDVVGWRLDEVVALIRGPKDSTVRLQVIPASGEAADSTATIAIVRDKVKLEKKAAQSQILNIEQNGQALKLGIIDVPAFYLDFEAYKAGDANFKSTTRDVARLVSELEAQLVDGIVLDLRNNGGGSLSEATAMTDLFIDRGPVVQIQDSNQRVYRNQRATRPAAYSGPLVVLINRLSASASEIFAGAMQDYGRALIVGSPSYGKGTVQNVAGLSSGQLKLTVSKFYRISGDSTQHRGVVPDILFPSQYNLEKVGESQLDNALPWDQIRGVPHSNSNSLRGLIAPLTEAYAQRSSNNPDFTFMVEKLALQEAASTEEPLTLNIEKRRARSTKWDEDLFVLENRRRIGKGSPAHKDIASWKASRDGDAEDTESGANLEDAAVGGLDEVDGALAQDPADAEIDEGIEIQTAEDMSESDPILFEAGRILIDQIYRQAEQKIKADGSLVVQIKNNKVS